MAAFYRNGSVELGKRGKKGGAGEARTKQAE